MLIKIPDTSELVATTVLNTRFSDVENKIPNTSNLVATNFLNTKINKVENKIPNHDIYITTHEFNKLTEKRFTARLKQVNLVTKSYFDHKLTSFNKRITSNKRKYLEVKKKLNSLIKNDSNFFLERINFTSNDGSQNTFVYQTTLDKLELKKDKGTDYVLSWKSNRVKSNFKLKPLYTALLHSINLSGYKMGIKFDKDPLAIKQNKIVNAYVVYELNA